LFCSNDVFLKGKLVDKKQERATPGGVILREFQVSCLSDLPWKQKKFINISVVAYGGAVEKLNTLKTGDEFKLKGHIDKNGDKLRLVTKNIF
jgi:hypothetical protein